MAVDIDNNGFVSAGDIYLGYLALDARTAPTGLDLDVTETNTDIIIPFSLTLTNFDDTGATTLLEWGETTLAGFTLQDLLGGALPAQDITGDPLAVVYTGWPDNANNPQDSASGFTDIIDVINDIGANATQELILGLADTSPHGGDDHFLGELDAGLNGSYALLDAASTASFFSLHAGLSVLTNLTGNVTFGPTLDDQASQDTPHGQPTFQNFDILIPNGDGNAVAPGDLKNFLNQTVTVNGTAYDLHGIINNADAALTPTIPEPGTLALLSAGLLGFGAIRRRKDKKQIN